MIHNSIMKSIWQKGLSRLSGSPFYCLKDTDTYWKLLGTLACLFNMNIHYLPILANMQLKSACSALILSMCRFTFWNALFSTATWPVLACKTAHSLAMTIRLATHRISSTCPMLPLLFPLTPNVNGCACILAGAECLGCLRIFILLIMI